MMFEHYLTNTELLGWIGFGFIAIFLFAIFLGIRRHIEKEYQQKIRELHPKLIKTKE